MAKAYFIGGSPRVGKTNLTMKLISESPMLASSTDAIRYMLRRVIDQNVQPDLFHLGKFTSNIDEKRMFMKNNPDLIIDIQNKESMIVWKSVNDFVKSNLLDGFDIVVEGIAILPEYLKDVDYDFNAVFLGNQSKVHHQTILSSARNNVNDWMHGLEDETIEAFSVFNCEFSKYIQSEAEFYGYKYIEIHDDNFNNDIDHALSTILK